MKIDARAFFPFAVLLLSCASWMLYLPTGLFQKESPVVLAPWSNIGGCGAGGSGGAGGSIRWIGQGVSGGLIDLEFIHSKNLGQNFLHDTYKTRLSTKLSWTTELGLTIPVVSKMGPLQPATQVEEEAGHVTGGLSDLALDLSRKFGGGGEFALLLNLTVPTGQFDIKRGKDNEKQYLPTNLQRGSGVWNAGMGLSYTRDVEEGLWIYEITYTHPMALNFRGKNPFVNGNADQFNEVHNRWDLHSGEEKKRFAYHFKPYGENDLGGFFPPSVNLAVFRGFRGHKGFVHSLGLTFNAPLGVAWIPSFNAVEYDPFPDPQFRAWSGSINYGLEFSRREIPIYLAVSKLIQDKTNTRDIDQDIYDEGVVSTWDMPDWNDFIQNWTFGVGLKAAMF